MKILKWLYANKVTLTGFIALLLYVLDEILDFSKNLEISQEAYYGIAALIFVIIGYAIKGRGLETVEEFKEAVEKQKKLKEAKTLEKKLELVAELLTEEQKEEIQEKLEEAKADDDNPEESS